MPRKLKKRNQSCERRLLTFSPFSRLIAMARARQEFQKPMLHNQESAASCVDGFTNNVEINTPLSEYSDNEESEGVVQVDFIVSDPEPSDFHGVKILLQTYLDNTQWDLSGFVDSILGQPTVGCVVKIENDEDDGVYSVVTALNLERYKDSKCVPELKNYLLKVCQDMNVKAKLKSLVGEHAQEIGLLVSQRVVNLPTQLLPPLYDALFVDVERAAEDEHKNAEQNRGPIIDTEETVIYVKPEDELFFELKNYRPMGSVMAVEAAKISSFRKQLHSLIDE